MTSDTEKQSKPPIPFAQILAPMLMLPLFMTPMDVGGLVYWLVCAIAAFISLFILLWRLIRPRKANLSAGSPLVWRVTLRPLLTVIIFAAAVAVGFIVELAASRYAADLVTHLQHACRDKGQCLPAPEGWSVDGKYARSRYGHWAFVYITNTRQSEFGLWIHRRNEDETCVHGGRTIPVSAVFSVYCKSEPGVLSNSF